MYISVLRIPGHRPVSDCQYRDALRTGEDKRFTPAAYVVYPGRKEKLYDEGRLGAIPMRPGTSVDQLVSAIPRGLGLD